ncbi:hypothetical protein DA075_06705 [Methylobacterium currus]|uniref:Uncharacterized protein n=1 Tax=Methylobacterium currus TaxID=2051553 RepID=A0A2R4WGJ7_9HYPH|nr:hypothetical protein [Methylobacterium currus]AWB20653.1 hypothetical protein DA075_06705 [Methylobacterium currus]UHC14604.1 hypothetical protein LRS73_18885 [Methylobacterium currus]
MTSPETAPVEAAPPDAVPPDAAPGGPRFSVVTAGPDGLELVVAFGPRDYAVRLSPAEAGELGLALLATASVAADAAQDVPAGTRVENCFFPVLGWTAGEIAPGVPALALRLAEGAEIAFQFDRDTARACGRDLARSGRVPWRERLGRVFRRPARMPVPPPANPQGA